MELNGCTDTRGDSLTGCIGFVCTRACISEEIGM